MDDSRDGEGQARDGSPDEGVHVDGSPGEGVHVDGSPGEGVHVDGLPGGGSPGRGSCDDAAGGFTHYRFESYGDDVGAGEIAELREIRSGLIEQSRILAAAEAERVRLLARAAHIAEARMQRVSRRALRGSEIELRSIAAEFAVVLRENDRTVQGRLGDAEQLVRLFPATVEALSEGRLSRAHATALADVGCRLGDPDVRAAFEQVVIEHAASDTPSRTRAFARGLVERLDPRSIDDRFAAASLDRRVTVTEINDGMARLEAIFPVTELFGIDDRLTRAAVAIRDADSAVRREHAAAGDRGEDVEPVEFDERTRDQVRADVFVDMLLTGAPSMDPTLDRSPGGIGAIRAHVQLTVPVTTITGVTVGGAELNGRSPVDTATACRLVGDAPGWDRVLTDPVHGTVIEVDRYEPLASQRRFLMARDVRCRFPGCRQPAHRCQVDHNEEHQHGGRTHLCNLCHLCVRHHTMKTETDWTVRQVPGGSLKWTSPLGFTYRDDPPARVVFVPEPHPDADPERGSDPDPDPGEPPPPF